MNSRANMLDSAWAPRLHPPASRCDPDGQEHGELPRKSKGREST